MPRPSPQPIDRFAAELPGGRRDAVRESAGITTGRRAAVLGEDYADPNALRSLAGAIKEHTLHHLDAYLEQAERSLLARGAAVHFANDAASARETIHQILGHHRAHRVVKSKSMAAEEIHLNPFLEEQGYEVVETDLGEFVVQLDGDEPSHIVRPIIHKSREEVARTLEEHGLGDYDPDPTTITRRARQHLRPRYLESDAAITGANFVSAESGRLVLVTNEGNARFGMAANRLHIALVGIEKVVPRDRDLAVFLNLLGRSATAQQLTVYTQFLRGPRGPRQPSGPEEMHVVFFDNGRSEILAGDCREILRCIRCGACQNVCPVYRQASGHAYRSNYGGPIGAVLTPLLAGDRFRDFADLPKASSLCGACQEVCPVDIPIPELLLRLRHRGHQEGIRSPGTPGMKPFGALATRPAWWRGALSGGRSLNVVPDFLLRWGSLGRWARHRSLPHWKGGQLRQWLAEREPTGETDTDPDPNQDDDRNPETPTAPTP